jgi:hypothetical protein
MTGQRPGKGRPRAVETAALVWSIWRWLPPEQKRQAIRLAQRHGPQIVSGAVRQGRKLRRKSV